LLFTKVCRGLSCSGLQRQEIPLAPGREIGYVIKDADRWKMDLERVALRFDIEYYRKLKEKAWKEMAFVFEHNPKDK
jgi:hypothetical protein